MLGNVLFYIFAAVAILGAILMVTRTSALHSVSCFAFTLLAIAGIILQLHAYFLFSVVLLLGVGGMGAFFFCIARSARMQDELPRGRRRSRKWIASLLVLALAAETAAILFVVRKPAEHGVLIPTPMPGEKAAPHGAEIARSLFSSYLLPFEITMILLIVALFGAVLMVRRRADAP